VREIIKMVRLITRGEGGSPHSLTVKRSFYEFHQQNMSIATNKQTKESKAWEGNTICH